MRTALVPLGTLVALLVAGCGSRVGSGTAGPAFTPTVAASARPSRTNGGVAATSGTTTSPATGTASPAAAPAAGIPSSGRRSCDHPDRVRCTDAAGARSWWLRGSLLEAPRDIPHTYVLFSPLGFGPDVRPSYRDGAALFLVVHPRGQSPRTVPLDQLVRSGAMLIVGMLGERPRAAPGGFGRAVTVQGRPGHLLDATDDRTGKKVGRIVLWSEPAGGQYVHWSVNTNLTDWTSDDEVLRVVNGMRRS